METKCHIGQQSQCRSVQPLKSLCERAQVPGPGLFLVTPAFVPFDCLAVFLLSFAAADDDRDTAATASLFAEVLLWSDLTLVVVAVTWSATFASELWESEVDGLPEALVGTFVSSLVVSALVPFTESEGETPGSDFGEDGTSAAVAFCLCVVGASPSTMCSVELALEP